MSGFRFALPALLALVGGCISGADLPARDFYVLEDAGSAAPAKSTARVNRTLLIAPVAVSAFYDTQSVAFSRTAGQRAYYQFASWTERPGRRLGELLVRRLEMRGGFTSVALTTAGVRGDLILNTRLDELFHDVPSASVRIELAAELVDRRDRSVSARRRFTQAAPVSNENAAAAAAAFNRATGILLDEVARWVEEAAAQIPAQ